MEERITRVETEITYIKEDIAEIKVDLRTLNAKFDSKFDSLKDSIHSAKIWALIIVGGVLTVMARGFGWI